MVNLVLFLFFSFLFLSEQKLCIDQIEREILFSVTFNGVLRAWSYEEMITTRDALSFRTILQDISGAHYLSISQFNSEIMMVLTVKDCLVTLYLN